MNKIEYSAIEKEMANFNFDELNVQKEKAKSGIAAAADAQDVKNQICTVWKKIGRYVKLAEAVPVVGKFIRILAEVLDSICAA